MKLYGFGQPSRATRVAWALEEAGADWSYVATSPRSDEVRQLNPLGRMPILVHDDFVLTESFACCTYVADQHPASGLAPAAGTRARADYDRWGAFVISELEQPLWTKAKHTFLLPEEVRVDVRAAVRLEFERIVGALATQLGDRPYIVGDRFTCADILVAHTLSWAIGAGFADALPDNVKAYGKAHAARPARASAMAKEKAGLGA